MFNQPQNCGDCSLAEKSIQGTRIVVCPLDDRLHSIDKSICRDPITAGKIGVESRARIAWLIDGLGDEGRKVLGIITPQTAEIIHFPNKI